MRQFRQVALGLTILGSIFAATNSVQASDCQYGQPKYKTYTVYQAVKVPHYSYVTKYHPCGTPYRVQVVSYRTVTAPVQKKVRIGY